MHSGLILQDDGGARRRFYLEALGLVAGPEIHLPRAKATVEAMVFEHEEGVD